MKQILSIFIFINFLTAGIIAGNTETEKLNSANNAYEAGNFENAVKLYEEIIELDYESAELFYNTANCYYRLNNIGLSVYYYEKAKLLDPFDEDIIYNLDLAELRIKDKPSEIPEFAVLTLFNKVSSALSVNLYGIISLVFFIAFLSLLYFYLNSENSKQKKIRFLFAAVLFFFSLISFIFVQHQLNLLNSDDSAVVISKEINAKSSPDEDANNIFPVYEGYKVTIEDKLNNWVEIKLTDGKKAWLKEEHLKIL